MPVRMRRKTVETGSSMPVWKNVIWVLVLLIIAVGVSEIIYSYRGRMWDGVNRFTVLGAGEHVYLLSIEPGNKEGIRLMLPDELEVRTIDARGKWAVKALPELSLKYGSDWLAKSISAYLGIAVDGVEKKLNFWDRAAWFLVTRNVIWKEINMEDSDMVSEVMAPDGEKVNVLNPIWEREAMTKFYSSNIADGGWRLSVYNTTGVEGVATRVANVAESVGYKVVSVDKSEEKVTRCEVLSTKENEKNTSVRWLSKYFGCEWREGKDLQGNELGLWLGSEYEAWVRN